MFKGLRNFLLLFLFALTVLWALKWCLSWPDYVIPGPRAMFTAVERNAAELLRAAFKTFGVAIAGHILSLVTAATVAALVMAYPRVGAVLRDAAYTIQSFPVIAIAPILFILLGDTLWTQLLITCVICYFPILLTFLAVLSEPVPDIEHFYASTGRLNLRFVAMIRLSERSNIVGTSLVGTATLAIVGSLVAEFIAADSGVGYAIRVALYRSNIAQILAALLVIGLGTCLYVKPLDTMSHAVIRRFRLATGSGMEEGS